LPTADTPPPPPAVAVIEPNTELTPSLPVKLDVVKIVEPAAPPAPIVTVILEPMVMAYPVAVNRPPAPPPPPGPVPPPPPPATTRYSTVVTGNDKPLTALETIPPVYLLSIKNLLRRFLPKNM
jgi:hypothetical protein